MHLFVVLSRMALVDTILPYLFTEKKREVSTGSDHESVNVSNDTTTQEFMTCRTWNTRSTIIPELKEKKIHHPKELSKSGWDAFNSETKSRLWQNHRQTLDADSPGALQGHCVTDEDWAALMECPWETCYYSTQINTVQRKRLSSIHTCVCLCEKEERNSPLAM